VVFDSELGVWRNWQTRLYRGSGCRRRETLSEYSMVSQNTIVRVKRVQVRSLPLPFEQSNVGPVGAGSLK